MAIPGLTLFAAAASAVSLTLHQYPGSEVLADSPPFCEMNYAALNLDRVTAKCFIDQSSCGECLHVCGSAGCSYLLVIDRCSRAGTVLDISTGAGATIVGTDTGVHDDVDVEVVGAEHCRDIWTGEMHPAAGPAVLSAPAMLRFWGMGSPVRQIEDGQVQVEAPAASVSGTEAYLGKGSCAREKMGAGIGDTRSQFGVAPMQSQTQNLNASISTQASTSTIVSPSGWRSKSATAVGLEATKGANASTAASSDKLGVFYHGSSHHPPEFSNSGDEGVGVPLVLLLLFVPFLLAVVCF